MKTIELPFGSNAFSIRVPDTSDVFTLPAMTPLADPRAELQRGLASPIGAPALAEKIRDATKRVVSPTAVIVVSDNTRPVPYAGPTGILEPLFNALRGGGVKRIVVLVATGTHHALNEMQLRDILPPTAFASDVQIVNHDCRDKGALRCIGKTVRGTDAWVNAQYLNADIKILTGLVEPHFMAGFSGGRKSICPGLVGIEATHIFHGIEMMADPLADSLVLDGNPCHEEALAVARLAGCDFAINVTIDRSKRLTGIFCGEMEAAHLAACEQAAKANAIPIAHEYDLVITHAGFAGINHYQAAKAACEGVKAVKPGGNMILVANHTDNHPVGGPHYRKVLSLLTELGPARFNSRLRSPNWTFVSEQWEVQKWAQVFTKLGAMGNLVYCAPRLTGLFFSEERIPGIDGGFNLSTTGDDSHLAAAMTQRAIDTYVRDHPDGSIAVLSDGPYGIPVRLNINNSTWRNE